jgi:hypothetical protein
VARGFSGRMVRETGQTMKGALGGLNQGGEEKIRKPRDPSSRWEGRGLLVRCGVRSSWEGTRFVLSGEGNPAEQHTAGAWAVLKDVGWP